MYGSLLAIDERPPRFLNRRWLSPPAARSKSPARTLPRIGTALDSGSSGLRAVSPSALRRAALASSGALSPDRNGASVRLCDSSLRTAISFGVRSLRPASSATTRDLALEAKATTRRVRPRPYASVHVHSFPSSGKGGGGRRRPARSTSRRWVTTLTFDQGYDGTVGAESPGCTRQLRAPD